MNGEDRTVVEIGEGWTLRRGPLDHLVWMKGSETIEDVRIVRCFPLSDPGGAVSVTDPEGRERAFIPRLDRLPGDVRSFLEREVRRQEFIPTVRRILSIRPRSEPNVWEVETDRGPTSFTVQADSDIRRLPPHGLLVVDARGVRFSIPDVRRLDRHSRRHLAPYR